MKKEILRLEHLYYPVQGQNLLDDISLNMFEHEILGVLGLVGAGKTLLADYLTGKCSIESGKVYYNDVEVKNCENLSNSGISVTHITNDTTLVSDFTIAMNFYIAIRDISHISYSKNTARAFAQTCLNEMNIRLPVDTIAGSLNKCHQHIIAMCIAFYCHSKIIIMDDALTGYSSQDIIDLQKFLDNLRKRDVSIMIMTHSVEYATQLSDRIAILKSGRNMKVIERRFFDRNTISKILLDSPISEISHSDDTEDYSHPVTISMHSTNDTEFSFCTNKGSISCVFDVENILCDSLETMRRNTLKLPVVFTAGTSRKRLSSVSQGFADRIAVIFSDYFISSLFNNVNLKYNIGLFSFGRLSRGTFGYIPKRRETVFLNDSKFYLQNNAKKATRDALKTAVGRQTILLERLRMYNPEYIVCVKSLSHLDPALMNLTFSYFRNMAESGTTILVLTNDYLAFSPQFDRVFVVKNGMLSATVEHEDLKNMDTVSKYLVSTSSGIV